MFAIVALRFSAAGETKQEVLVRNRNVTVSALFCAAALVWAGSAAALNPQPLPPGRHFVNGMSTKKNFEQKMPNEHNASIPAYLHNGLNAGPRKLNPQPLPPG